MPLKTTVVGAWPKPSFLALPNWFKGSSMDYNPNMRTGTVADIGKEEVEQDVRRAVKEVTAKQVGLGLDVITDGEVERETYYTHLLRSISGVDMEMVEKKDMRAGACTSNAPVVRGAITMKGEPQCWREWRRSADLVGEGAVVKYTIPGPMTLVDGLVDKFYNDEEKLRADLVAVIQKEILGLADHGCRCIQIDEPVIMRYPDKALQFGIDDLTKCFSVLPDNVTKVVHFCCGYPDYLDQEDYRKAPCTNYNRLADKLENAGFNEVSIEDAEARNDLKLLEKFKKTKVIMGVVRVARSRVETVEEITERVQEALKYIEKDRLILAPDCGLGFLPPEVAEEKIKKMVEAAKNF